MVVDNNYEISVEELKKYEKKWVAVLNGKIVCSGDTMKEAGDKFKKLYKKETPLLDRIPDKAEAEALFF